MIAPAWVNPRQWRELKPPPDVLAFGTAPRSAANLLGATRALQVLTAPRYQPDARRTWCNIFVSDACAILAAPLPHVFDLADGKGPRELTANMMIDGLRAGKFPGWSRVDPHGRAARGLPTVATWRNTGLGSGHVVIVVPGHTAGLFVTGAGRRPVQEEPIARAFGSLPVEFFGHD